MKLTRIFSAFALTLALASGANAGLVGVKSVQIKSGVPTWLQVAEFRAFNITNVNVAASANGGFATSIGDYGSGSVAANANDGSTLGTFPNIFHSATFGAAETLTITFSAVQELLSFDIFGRSDSNSFRDIYDISFKDSNGATLQFIDNLSANNLSNRALGTLNNTNQGVPEPGSLALVGLALVGLAGARRK